MKTIDSCVEAVEIASRLREQEAELKQRVRAMLDHTLDCSDCKKIHEHTKYYQLLVSGIWRSREDLVDFVYTMEVEEPVYPKDFEALNVTEIGRIIENFRLRQAYWERAEETLSNN